MDWYPIETAPKSTPVLLWARGWSIELGIYFGNQRGEEGWHHWEGSRKFFSEPTHWMPLPDPPSAKEAAVDPPKGAESE